jgi:WS/DGAT/MGAT family acyltransferase
MHVGAITIFDGPPMECDELFRHVQERLHLVPRYRQKVVWPGMELGRPVWVDDPCFNLDYHVRHTALPRPGSRDQLRKLAARVFSQQLDRDKPLWEMWLVDGMEDDRFAIVSKTHHCLIDGMSGVDILSTLFDTAPEGREIEPPGRAWQPAPKPSGLEVKAEALGEIATRPLRILRKGARAVSSPQRTVQTVTDGLQGIKDLLVGPMLSPAPDVPLNTSIGPHRRVQWVSFDLDDFKGVKNALGGTVNDVVLATVAGGLRRWLRAHGTRTEGLELRAMVPVSIRTEDERHQFGNRVAAMRGPLPVWAEDPVERLHAVRDTMQGLKDSKQALGAEVLADLQGFAPPTLLAMGARINFSTRLFNTIVTNVPGPQFPLYLAGRRLVEMVPLGFLPDGHAVFFAIMSYDGKLVIGLLGERDAMEDIDDLAAGLRDALEELKSAAGVTGKPPRGPAPRRRAPAGRNGRVAALSGANGRAH